jgi:hypothetical protein
MIVLFADIAAPAAAAAAPTAWQQRCKATLEKVGISGAKIITKTWADSTLGEQPMVVLDVDVKDKRMMAVSGRQYPTASSKWYQHANYAVRSGARHFAWASGDDGFLKAMMAALDRCILDGDQGDGK